MGKVKYGLGLVVCLFTAYFSSAQFIDPGTSGILSNEELSSSTPSQFVVRNIVITGNRKTKPDILLRELPFRSGDKYNLDQLVKKFELARQQLMNTALFHEVYVSLKSLEGYNVDIAIDVKERWYIFPIPYVKAVYRDINQWLAEEKGNLNKINYGLKLIYNNVTGRNDKLNIWLVDGYSRNFSFNYDRIYIDKGLKWGMDVGFSVGKTREVNYNTAGDKQLLLRDNNAFMRSSLYAKAELTYRRAIKTRHRFGLSYTDESVEDTVIKLNPSYFPSGLHRVSFPELYYTMTYFDVDYIPYPTEGYGAEFSFSKKGVNKTINSWQFTLKGSANWHLSPKNYLNLRSFFTIKLPFKQPYYNRRLLGYGDVFMQGYEYYVVDGVMGAYFKAAVTRELFNFKKDYYRKKKDEYFHLPFRVFAKIFVNAGYIDNTDPGDNSLSNRMLYSAGVGVDVLTIYDFTLKLEWSFNQLGQNGVFLHRTSYF